MLSRKTKNSANILAGVYVPVPVVGVGEIVQHFRRLGVEIGALNQRPGDEGGEGHGLTLAAQTEGADEVIQVFMCLLLCHHVKLAFH